ncbi:LTA synthase family protein [Geomesophilobacter sediminis]|uniref:LTA synthase family protein n=1 Tax=Geomesophilobacter sediminis TaxID=2798584 RepID=A0A8J7JMG0_9BACT|nr:LTA synthase family protein [Geomesophilobacter sediminis]MBJ6725940.1 LTA synthase family protein [Geomesophilobacter sediminis]
MTASPAAPFAREFNRFFGFTSRYLAFWLLYFFLCRIAFVAYHGTKAASLSAATSAGIFAHGAYIDLSAACYLTILPFLVWMVSSYLPFRGARSLVSWYSRCCIVVVAVISVGDLQVYKEWGTKVNAQAIAYLRYPKEAFASVSSSPLLLLVLLALSLALAGHFLYARIGRGLPFEPAPAGGVVRIPLFLVFGGLIFLGIRGSVGQAPMNPSFAYFSPNQFANHAAINPEWNLLYDVKYYLRDHGNAYVYLDPADARSRTERLMRTSLPNDTESILTTNRPNIVVFILESWTADVVASLGAEKGITPNFEDLVSQGMLFTNFFANGYRSSYGIPAVLGGFPSTPDGSVLNHPLKMERLPTLGGVLKKAGYASSFHYGGDDRFDDMIAFIVHSGFDKVVDREAFDKKDMNSKWGAQDHVLFQRVIDDLNKQRQPFFSAMFTLSSHEPFEVPMTPVYPGKDEVALFKNAVHYSDRSLKGFFERARKQSWYPNTLFVFVADHGHTLPLHRNSYQPERFRIPLLLYGEVLKKQYRGVKNPGFGSQSDIAATLLAQLGLSHDEFLWSNNLLNRRRNDYAFYNSTEGFALATPEQITVFSHQSKKVIQRSRSGRTPVQDAESLKDTQAYMQYLYDKYSRL